MELNDYFDSVSTYDFNDYEWIQDWISFEPWQKDESEDTETSEF